MSSYLSQITEPLIMQTYATLFFATLVLCFVIILASGYGFSRRASLDASAVQSAHSGFVPRVGGLAIYISLLGLIPLLSFGFIPLSVVFDLNLDHMIWLILSAIPVFLVGLVEDLGYPMSPKIRLLGSAVSSLFALIIFKSWLSKVGIPGFDILLIFSPFAVLFTVFATVGVVNAFNLIDGLNGLSGYTAASIAFSISIISFRVADTQTTLFLVLIVAALMGFLVLNFPFGKIFLGDGGAYVLGHLLVWSSVILVENSVEVSTFAVLLVFFWPVADTGLAIWRRWKLGNPTDRPDRLHFHQLTMRYLEIRFFGRGRRAIVNPISTLILIPMISMPQFLGVLFWDDFAATVWCFCGVGLLFIMTYLFGIKIAKKSRSLNEQI